MADQLFPGFNLLNPVTYVPVFGNWCGPSWSAGQRTSGVLTAEQLLVGGLTVTGADGIRRQSLVDLACKAHDIEYSAAEGKPNQALLTLQADLTLVQSVSTLNWNQLNSNEKVYAGAMAAAFIAKLASVDVLGLFVDGTSALRAAAVTAMQQILNLAAPFGNQYGDGAGNTISWAKDSNGLISIASTQATQTETFKLDAAGNRTFDFKNSNYEEIQVANSVASINANILGRGDIISISNANITLGDASSATITGSANKITTGNVGRVVVNGNGNNLSGSQGHIEFGDGSSGNINSKILKASCYRCG